MCRYGAALSWALLAALAPQHALSRAVFAHYMIGTVDPSTNHAQTDIDQAIAAGFDAFALNVGAPTASWAQNTTAQLFDRAAGTPLKLFFSFDLSSWGNIDDHLALYDQFQDHTNYYQVNGKNLISAYGGQSLGPSGWADVRARTGGYIAPDVDGDANYYSDPQEFFSQWDGALDGVFSWETAWPANSNAPVNTSAVVDQGLIGIAQKNQKTYIMGLSSLQYKHCCGASPYYRVGEVNLPQRMTEILQLQPDFAEVITWNDAGESHYIGPCWPEGLNAEILAYGNSDAYTHNGWQPLIASFNDAYRAGVQASQMRPYHGSPNGITAAMWYRGVLTSCAGALPEGVGAAIDAVNYAVVLPEKATQWLIRVWSGGKVLREDYAQAGLNYNSVAGMVIGAQKVEVVDCSGAVVAMLTSVIDVQQGPVNGFCNFNYYVVGV